MKAFFITFIALVILFGISALLDLAVNVLGKGNGKFADFVNSLFLCSGVACLLFVLFSMTICLIQYVQLNF